MSGCRNGDRLAFPDGVIRGCVRFTDGVEMPLSYSAAGGRGVESFEMDGRAYLPRASCVMSRTYAGDPCSDWTCSACGKTHTVHNAARVGEFCPRCGAEVAEVVA